MPTEHFESEEAYRKWNAYRHMHGIAAPNLKNVVINGKEHKVKHSKVSYKDVREARKSGEKRSYREAYESRKSGD